MKPLNTIKKEIENIKKKLKSKRTKLSKFNGYHIRLVELEALLKQTEEIIILLKKEFGEKDFLWAVNTESPSEVKDRTYKIIDKLIGEEKK